MGETDAVGLDIRDLLFADISDTTFVSRLRACEPGLLSGSASLREKGEETGITFRLLLAEGAALQAGTIVAEFEGNPKQLALCEESLMGVAAKFSGVATAAAAARLAAGRIRVVCGAWKKMPGELKQALRRAISTGGMATRLADQNFVYLDKNYVRMLGGIEATLAAARELGHRVKAIQIRGETMPIGDESLTAARAGADILMVDTGQLDDVRSASAALRADGSRSRVRIAYAGGIAIQDLPLLQDEDIDIVDIGRAVIDAPLLDMSMDVVVPHAGVR